MRRWLCVFMMVFLPVQFGWAAVASYCDFETPAQSRHAGHHDHLEHHAHHDGGTPAAVDDDGGTPAAVDDDDGTPAAADDDDGTPAAADDDAAPLLDSALAAEVASDSAYDIERGHHHHGEFAVALLSLPVLPRAAEAAADATVWLSATPLAPPQRRPERPQWRHRA